MKLKTGIERLDELTGGGIESGSRNILYGPPGTGKTVFAMQFLWQAKQWLTMLWINLFRV